MCALAKVLNLIELTPQWPEVLCRGRTTMVPEDDVGVPSSFRPITLLSAVYRLWSKARWLELKEKWLPHWIHSSVFGLGANKGPDAMMLQACLGLEAASARGEIAGGISYDLSDAHERLRPHCGIYIHGHVLDAAASLSVMGAVTRSFTPHNGLIQ
eukprot:2043703-Amphidinium_carterae.1